MTRRTFALAALAALLLALAAGCRNRERNAARGAAPGTSAAAAEPHPEFLYGRVTNLAGATYQGRLRFGGDQEAFWTDHFNGVKVENPWAARVPAGRLPRVRGTVEIFGVRVRGEERPADLRRPFMARFGDIVRIEAARTDARITLKSGAVVVVNRFDASDFDDGVRVWDPARGVVDVDTRLIRTIEFLPAPGSGAVSERLHGTVRAGGRTFTGFVQWNRDESLGSDALDGRAGETPVSFRFDAIRAIARIAPDASRVTLRDGREAALSGTSETGRRHRGIYVDDPRYGRVLVSWEAFERVDFSLPGTSGGGPAYGDFPPGRPLAGSVTTREGRRIAGRLVYDLDESETIETLDAPSGGVTYMIPFGLIAAIEPAAEGSGSPANVTLHSGEELHLARDGDLGDANGGMLIFAEGADRPDYVPWGEVARIDIERPPAMVPPLPGEPGP